MSFGVYIVGNDRVCNHVVALVKSLRYFNPGINVTLIPYTQDYQRIRDCIEIDLFDDFSSLMEISLQLQKTLSLPEAPAQSNKFPRLHNLASWLGPYDRFVSLDADIVFFRDIEKFALDLLEGYDFAFYDRTYLHNGKWVFTDKARELFSPEAYRKLFNNGFWVSRKEAITKQQILDHLVECANMYEYFDFKSGVIAQPIINSLILKHVKLERINNYLATHSDPEPWSGFKYEEVESGILGQSSYRLPFLHWAGKEICEDNRYWNVWKYYFDLVI